MTNKHRSAQLVLPALISAAIFLPASRSSRTDCGRICLGPCRPLAADGARDTLHENTCQTPRDAKTSCRVCHQLNFGRILRLRGGALDNTRYYEVLKLPVGEDDEHVSVVAVCLRRVLCLPFSEHADLFEGRRSNGFVR